MRVFPSDKHVSSWAGICPGNNESAGKSRSGATTKGNASLRRALCQAAWGASHTKATYFSEAFHRWAARRGKKRAIVAVAHSLLVTVYHVLRTKKPYEDLGEDHFNKLDPERQIRYHVRKLAALGKRVSLEPAA